MMFSVVFVMHIICRCYYLVSEVIGCRQLVNYCFIIQLYDCMYSFYYGGKFKMIIIFYVELVNNKVVDNLLYIVLTIHSHRPNGLRIIVVISLLLDLLILWTDLED